MSEITPAAHLHFEDGKLEIIHANKTGFEETSAMVTAALTEEDSSVEMDILMRHLPIEVSGVVLQEGARCDECEAEKSNKDTYLFYFIAFLWLVLLPAIGVATIYFWLN